MICFNELMDVYNVMNAKVDSSYSKSAYITEIYNKFNNALIAVEE